MLEFTFSHSSGDTRVNQHRYRNSVKHTLQPLEAAKVKAYQRAGPAPGWTFYPMAGTAFGAIGDQAVACLPLLTPYKDYSEKLCRPAVSTGVVWRYNEATPWCSSTGSYHCNLARHLEPGEDRRSLAIQLQHSETLKGSRRDLKFVEIPKKTSL